MAARTPSSAIANRFTTIWQAGSGSPREFPHSSAASTRRARVVLRRPEGDRGSARSSGRAASPTPQAARPWWAWRAPSLSRPAANGSTARRSWRPLMAPDQDVG
eukprot:9888690-Alexandrium_andersonii.AAC.2